MSIRIKLIPKDDELMHALGRRTHKYKYKYISKKSGKWVYVYDGDLKNPDRYSYTLYDEKNQPMSVDYKTEGKKEFKDKANVLRYIDDILKTNGFENPRKNDGFSKLLGKEKYDYSDIKNVTISKIKPAGKYDYYYKLKVHTKDGLDHTLWMNKDTGYVEKEADEYVDRNYLNLASYDVGGGGRKSKKR